MLNFFIFESCLLAKRSYVSQPTQFFPSPHQRTILEMSFFSVILLKVCKINAKRGDLYETHFQIDLKIFHFKNKNNVLYITSHSLPISDNFLPHLGQLQKDTRKKGKIGLNIPFLLSNKYHYRSRCPQKIDFNDKKWYIQSNFTLFSWCIFLRFPEYGQKQTSTARESEVI